MPNLKYIISISQNTKYNTIKDDFCFERRGIQKDLVMLLVSFCMYIFCSAAGCFICYVKITKYVNCDV